MQEMPDDMLKELRLGYRFGVTKDWAQAAHAVATSSRLESAQAVWEYISAYTTLGVPAPDRGVDYFFTHRPSSHLEQYVFLTPVISDDHARLPAVDERLRYTANPPARLAEFQPGPRAIYLSEFDMSTRAKGLLLLREAHRARAFTNKTAETDAQPGAQAWILIFDIALALGGQPYAELLEQTKQSATYDDAADRLQTGIVQSTSTTAIWAQQFDATSTPTEQALWNEVLLLHAAWVVARERSTDPNTSFGRLLVERSAEPS